MTYYHYRAKDPVVETLVSRVCGKPTGGWNNRLANTGGWNNRLANTGGWNNRLANTGGWHNRLANIARNPLGGLH
jgi:hypothetical protein